MFQLEEIQIHAKEDPRYLSTDGLVLTVLDEVLADLLGTRVREAIYDYMAREHHVAKEELPKHLDEFSTLLQGTFGKGAETIERMLVKRLAEKIGRGERS